MSDKEVKQVELHNLDYGHQLKASLIVRTNIPHIYTQQLQQEHKNQQYQQNKSTKFSRISRLSVQDLKTALNFMRESWRSGMSQALLSMPFALNAGNSSGCHASIGLSTAFAAALVNGLFSGSNHSIYVPNQLSGAFNFQIAQKYGVEAVPWVTLLIGLIIYVCSLFKWHHLVDFLPTFAIEGYFWGLGFVIFNNYIDYAFGLTDYHSNRGFTPYENRFEMYYNYFQRGDLYYLIASFTIFLYLYIGNKLSRPFPWVLTTTCFGLAIGVLYPTEKCLKSVYGNAGLQFNFLEAYGPNFTISFNTLQDLIVDALPMAFLITFQNLICAKGAETLTGVKCDMDQEAICVSVANIVSGLLGCLPCNAQQRLYVLDIKAREINQWSSMINACSVFIFYGVFSAYFMEIPLYIISGQIMFSAYQCPTWSYVDRLFTTHRYLTILKCCVVAILSTYYGAVQSSVIASLYALLRFAEKMSAAACEILMDSTTQSPGQMLRQSMILEADGVLENRKELAFDQQDDLPTGVQGSYILYRFNGSINYINVKNHVEQIKNLPKTETVAFSFRYVSIFDESGLDRLAIIMENILRSGRDLWLTGLHKNMIEQMSYTLFFKEFIELKPDRVKLLGIPCMNI